MTLSLGLSNLLEQLTELRKIITLLEFLAYYKVMQLRISPFPYPL